MWNTSRLMLLLMCVLIWENRQSRLGEGERLCGAGTKCDRWRMSLYIGVELQKYGYSFMGWEKNLKKMPTSWLCPQA